MARVFVRLKLALLRGRFRGNWQAKLGMILSLVFGLPVAVGGAIGLAIAGRAADVDVLLAVITCTLLSLSWTLGPPLFFGVDDTLDPARLLPLPLRRRDLATGMLAASTIGLGPTITAGWLLGLFLGIAPIGPGAVIVLIALVMQFAACVVVSRLITTGLSNLLRSRRGRDVTGFLLAAVFIVLPQLPNLVTQSSTGVSITRDTLDGIVNVVGWTPFGWLGRAAGVAATGDVVAALGPLVLGTVMVAVFARWWLFLLDRQVTRSPDVGPRASRRTGLFVGVAARLPQTRLGATTAKELRYYVREPRHRVAMMVAIGFGTMGAIAGAVVSDGSPRGVLAVAATGLMFALLSINIFGIDGPATAQLVLVGGDHRLDLAGKNLAVGMVAVPLIVVQAVVIAIVIGSWSAVPAAILGAVAFLLVGVGIGNVSSVQFAAPQADISQNVFGGASGQNVTNGLLQAVTIMGIGLLALPFVIAALLVSSAVGLTVVALIAAAVGTTVWWFGLRLGATRMTARAPELLADLQPN